MLDYKKFKELIDVESSFALLRCTDNIKFDSVLDVGFGKGGSSLYFAQKGKKVTSIGLNIDSYGYPKNEFQEAGIQVFEEDFLKHDPKNTYDAIYMQAVLEHTQNPGLFLEKARNLLNDDGWLFVIVPPYKSRIVGGHVTPGWNIGILMYNLLLSGFDIKNGHFISYEYNVCGFVKKSHQELPKLVFDNGDIERTAHLWPIEVYQDFEGDLGRINWFDDFDKMVDKEVYYDSGLPTKILTFLEQNIGKKICLYGAGKFANYLINNYDLSKYNILGVVDKDESKAGKQFNDYPIFSIDSLKQLKPDVLVVTVLNYEAIVPEIKSHFSRKGLDLQIFSN